MARGSRALEEVFIKVVSMRKTDEMVGFFAILNVYFNSVTAARQQMEMLHRVGLKFSNRDHIINALLLIPQVSI